MDDARSRCYLRADGSGDLAVAHPKGHRSDDRDAVWLATGRLAASHLLQPVCTSICDLAVLRRLRNIRILSVVDDASPVLEIPLRCLRHRWPVFSPYRPTGSVRATGADLPAGNLGTHTRSRILESERI